tara:strand:+ start:334 stop:975 length:642 start_codon:yes stop_codon:yes gene_type:complete
MSLIKSTKEFYKIIIDYKFSIFFFIIYEIFYLLKGYTGFRFTFSSNKSMTNTIPCPYYFLYLIKKDLNLSRIDSLIDFGSGYGRIVHFFNKNFSLKKILGIEYASLPYAYCLKKFNKETNIEFINNDFDNFDLKKYCSENQLSDVCLFFSAPFSKSQDMVKYISNINLLKIPKIKIIIVNYEYDEILKINNLKIITKQYINKNRGFCICTFGE